MLCAKQEGIKYRLLVWLDLGLNPEFEFQSRYYIHFRTNKLGIGMNPLILPVGWTLSLLFFNKDGFGIK